MIEDTSMVTWGSWDDEAVEEEDKQYGGSGKFMKLQEGDNVVRFLPPPQGARSPFVTVEQHYFEPAGGDFVSFVCPKRMAKQKCPLCHKAQTLSQSNSEADRNAAKKLFPSRRTSANVIDMSDPEAGPKILTFGKMIYDALRALRKNSVSGGNFVDPINGFDIVINRTGQGLKTKYTVNGARTSTKLKNLDVIADQHDLAAMSVVLPLADIMEKLGAPMPENDKQLTGQSVIDVADDDSGTDDMQW